jgi:hypothetical protein
LRPDQTFQGAYLPLLAASGHYADKASVGQISFSQGSKSNPRSMYPHGDSKAFRDNW